ncbi:MAG: VOC family protein [Nitratireductor sp.]
MRSRFWEFTKTGNQNAPITTRHEPGFAHIAFEVENIRAVRSEIIRLGGTDQGKITALGTSKSAFVAVYMRDPEGNVIELEQS